MQPRQIAEYMFTFLPIGPALDPCTVGQVQRVEEHFLIPCGFGTMTVRFPRTPGMLARAR